MVSSARCRMGMSNGNLNDVEWELDIRGGIRCDLRSDCALAKQHVASLTCRRRVEQFFNTFAGSFVANVDIQVVHLVLMVYKRTILQSAA